MSFEEQFRKVKPIIFKLRRYYFVRIWEYDDWLQEGRLVLFQLMEAHPDLAADEHRLLVYFKTKFSNYVKNVIRQQESQKRKFNRLGYEAIDSLGERLGLPGLLLDDYVAYCQVLEQVKADFGEGVTEQLDKIIRGERFAGKKELLKKLKPYFKEF